MGKTNSALNAFITGIPDDKLSGFKDIIYALYKDTNFTLVHEGVWLPIPVSSCFEVVSLKLQR